MKKVIKWFGIVVGVLILVFGLLISQPWVFLPHKHIEISLPFAPADDDVYLIPMGEQIEHNAANGNPNGHPGIDFGWDRKVVIIASADGRISKVSKFNNQGYEVSETSGYYHINYKEVGDVAAGIKSGAKVKRGDLIGYTATNKDTPKNPDGTSSNHQQIHWELTSSSMILDRLCPVNYFDADSKTRVEKIWSNMPITDQFKKLYPDICSGYYKNRED